MKKNKNKLVIPAETLQKLARDAARPSWVEARRGTGVEKSKKDYTRKPKHKNRESYDFDKSGGSFYFIKI